MRSTISYCLLLFALCVSTCYAAPADRRWPKDKDPKGAAAPGVTMTVTEIVQASSPPPAPVQPSPVVSMSALASSVVSMPPPAASASPPQPPATMPMPAAGMGPPALLSQATAEEAGGGVPFGPPPAMTFSPGAIPLFRVANFIENIESSFFSGVLNSLGNDPAFIAKSPLDGRSMANVTSQIAAQELVHIATVGGLLGLVGQANVPACAKVFPVQNTTDYLAKANVITGVAIGVIINILSALSTTDPNLVTPLASILSTESQQDTFFRMTGANTPSAAPFNTAISTTFAVNIALTYADPRSCPELPPNPLLPSLNMTSPMMTATAPATPPTSITFTASGNLPQGQLYMGWINQANPVNYTMVTINNGIGTADIPKGMSGLAFGALTAQNTAVNVDALSNATIAGPGVVLLS